MTRTPKKCNQRGRNVAGKTEVTAYPLARANDALARLLETPAATLLGQPFWTAVAGDLPGEVTLLGGARRGERVPPMQFQSPVVNRTLRLTAAPLAEPEERAALAARFDMIPAP